MDKSTGHAHRPCAQGRVSGGLLPAQPAPARRSRRGEGIEQESVVRSPLRPRGTVCRYRIPHRVRGLCTRYGYRIPVRGLSLCGACPCAGPVPVAKGNPRASSPRARYRAGIRPPPVRSAVSIHACVCPSHVARVCSAPGRRHIRMGRGEGSSEGIGDLLPFSAALRLSWFCRFPRCSRSASCPAPVESDSSEDPRQDFHT